MSSAARTAPLAASEDALAHYVTGLQNAHALESQATQLIDRQLERLTSYPEVEALLRGHLVETREQMARLERLLDGLGSERSMLKDLATSLTGNLAAMAHAVMSDEVLKNHYANHAFENFEIAAYTSLITMAQATGHEAHVTSLRQSLSEEERTATALREMTPALTLKYLELSAAGARADR